MNANTKCEIRELNADELGLVAGNGIGSFIAAVGWLPAVAADYYFNAYGGTFFHASAEEKRFLIGD
jgi:hypothetical protein